MKVGQSYEEVRMIQRKFNEIGWSRIKFITNPTREMEAADIFLKLIKHPKFDLDEKVLSPGDRQQFQFDPGLSW